MRQFIVLIVFIAGTGISYGQHTEFSLQAGSGLFSFGGPGSAKETGLGFYGGPIFNPYGHESGFSYSLTGQVQRVAKSAVIYGMQAGYESLTSQVPLTFIAGDFGPGTPIDGRATLQNGYLNVNPFIGKRLTLQRISFDLVAGADVGVTLSSQERGSLTKDGKLLPLSNLYRGRPDVDFRPRLNLTSYYRAFGLSLGYSHGLTNYANTLFDSRKVYSRMWRVGLVYRLVKRA